MHLLNIWTDSQFGHTIFQLTFTNDWFLASHNLDLFPPYNNWIELKETMYNHWQDDEQE